MNLQPSDPVTGGLNRLTWEYGVLGIVCVILFTAISWLFKHLQKANAEKVELTQGFASALKQQNDAAVAMIVETNRNNDALQAGFGKLREACHDLAVEVREHQKTVSALEKTQAEFIAVAKAQAKEWGR